MPVIEKTKTATNNQEQHMGTSKPNLSNAIRIENLCISYDDTQVIKDMNGRVPAHKISVIFGPSGSSEVVY